MYSRNRSPQNGTGNVYYGRRQTDAMPVVRQSPPAEPAGTPFSDASMPPPPPFYSGTMYQAAGNQNVENGKINAPEPEENKDRATCGEHARDDIPQRIGQEIPELNPQTGSAEREEVPVRIRTVRQTNQRSLRDYGERVPRPAALGNDRRETDGRTLLDSLQQQLSALGKRLSGEELLLIALIVMLLNSGADDLTILALAWLLAA